MADTDQAVKESPKSETSPLFWLFALSVALLPIGLGGNRPIPLGLAQFGLAASFLVCFSNKDIFEGIQFPKRMLWAVGLLLIAVFWAFIQTQGFVPASWANPFWLETQKALIVPVTPSIAMNPEAALLGLSKLLTYIAAGFLAFVIAQEPKRARQLIEILWVSGTAICFYGLTQQIFQTQKILWFDKWSNQDDLTATFVNHNDFSIYAALTLVCGTGLLMQSWREKVSSVHPSARLHAIREWLIRNGILRIFLILLVLACIFFSHSRAGLILGVVGIFATAFFFQIYAKNYKSAVFIAFFSVLAMFAVFVLAMEFSERFTRLLNDYSSRDRAKVYGLVLQAIKDNPFFGYGLGNFEPVFRQYQHGMVMEFNHAHSDILESLLDYGVPVALILWSAIGLLLSGLVHGMLTRRRHGLFSVVALAASFIVLCHAGINFSLQIPGIAVIWAALLGSGLAQSWSKREERPV